MSERVERELMALLELPAGEDPLLDEIGDREPRFCPGCAREAYRWRAGDALSATGAAAGDAR